MKCRAESKAVTVGAALVETMVKSEEPPSSASSATLHVPSSDTGTDTPSQLSSTDVSTGENKAVPPWTDPCKKRAAKSAVQSRSARSHSGASETRKLRPSPYFYYVDHSLDVDSDPFTLLSPPLSVPNFLIKLHAILILDSMKGVIEWMPHGRSWKILDQVCIVTDPIQSCLILHLPRSLYLISDICFGTIPMQNEFEKRVLPTYFKQGSMGSFYRQANGWGFRRKYLFWVWKGDIIFYI